MGKSIKKREKRSETIEKEDKQRRNSGVKIRQEWTDFSHEERGIFRDG